MGSGWSLLFPDGLRTVSWTATEIPASLNCSSGRPYVWWVLHKCWRVRPTFREHYSPVRGSPKMGHNPPHVLHPPHRLCRPPLRLAPTSLGPLCAPTPHAPRAGTSLVRLMKQVARMRWGYHLEQEKKHAFHRSEWNVDPTARHCSITAPGASIPMQALQAASLHVQSFPNGVNFGGGCPPQTIWETYKHFGGVLQGEHLSSCFRMKKPFVKHVEPSA